MKEKIVTLFLIMLAALLFPYMAVILFVGTDIDTDRYDDTYKIILKDGQEVSAQDYLVGILAKEIDPGMEMETLKAQAVLARTWLCRSMGTNIKISEEALSINAMSLSQMKSLWKEKEYIYYEKLYSAVRQTKWECLFYEDIPAAPLFHKISAGQTRQDQTGNCPYLISVDCVFDVEAPGYQMVRQLSKEELVEKINRIDEKRQIAETLTASQIELVSDNQGYVLEVHAGGHIFASEEIATALEISSLWYRIEDYAQNIRVIAKGIGHGYGMSQYGADHYAKEGKDYKWILNHYFFNTVCR